MGIMRDFDIRIRNGGDDAIAAVTELMDSKIHDDVVRELRPWLAQRQWVPVTERLPEDSVRVLGYDGDRVFEAEVFDGQWIWVSNKAHGWAVTHWMPLPAPPNMGSDGPNMGSKLGSK